MDSSSLPILLGYYGPQIPLYIIWFVGISIAMLRYRHNPTSMLLAIIAFIIFLLSSIVLTGLNASILLNRAANGQSITEIQGQLALVTLGQVAATLVGWVLLLVALFRGNTDRRELAD